MTYPDVELDDAPHNKHGRVAVAKLNPVDLLVPEDGAERGEEAQQENDNQANLLARVDLELEKHGDRDHGDDHVRYDGDNGVCRERRAGR